MHPSHSLSSFSINCKPFTISFVCSGFKPPKLKCPNLKCHNQESSCILDWNVPFISIPFYLFLILHTLFSSLELHTLSTINAVYDCASYALPTNRIVFFFLVGFYVKGNIFLLVIWILSIS